MLASSFFFMASFAIFCSSLSFKKAIRPNEILPIVKSQKYLLVWSKLFVVVFAVMMVAEFLPVPFGIATKVANLFGIFIIAFSKDVVIGMPQVQAKEKVALQREKEKWVLQKEKERKILQRPKPKSKKAVKGIGMKGFALLAIFLLVAAPFAFAHVEPTSRKDLINVKVYWTGGTVIDDGDYLGAGEIYGVFNTEEKTHGHGLQTKPTDIMSVSSGDKFPLPGPMLLYSHDQCHVIDPETIICYDLYESDDDEFVQMTKEAMKFAISYALQLLVGEYTAGAKITGRIMDGLSTSYKWIADLSIGKKAYLEETIGQGVSKLIEATIGATGGALGEGVGNALETFWKVSPDKIIEMIADFIAQVLVDFFYQYVVGVGADDLGGDCLNVSNTRGSYAGGIINGSARLEFDVEQKVIEKDSPQCGDGKPPAPPSETLLCSEVGKKIGKKTIEYNENDYCVDNCGPYGKTIGQELMCDPGTCTCKPRKEIVCGDGEIWNPGPKFIGSPPKEECDDGSPATANCGEGKVCQECKCIDLCGNSEIDESEECDPGSPTTIICNPDSMELWKCENCKCVKPCGNGELDIGEECDEGSHDTSYCKAGLDEKAKACKNCVCVEACGDGKIQAGEDCDPGSAKTPCPIIYGEADCVSCKCIKECGNGIINESENCDSCPADAKCPENQSCMEGACVSIGSTCGNYKIETGENCSNCPRDVKCPSGTFCNRGVCQTIYETPVTCGNSRIDSGENCSNCPADVRCPEDTSCSGGKCIDKDTTILGSGSDGTGDFVKCNPESTLKSASFIDVTSHYVSKEGNKLRFVLATNGNIPATTSDVTTFIFALSDSPMNPEYPDRVFQQNKYGVVAKNYGSGWVSYLGMNNPEGGTTVPNGIESSNISGNTLDIIVPLEKIGNPQSLHMVVYSAFGGGCDGAPNSGSVKII